MHRISLRICGVRGSLIGNHLPSRFSFPRISVLGLFVITARVPAGAPPNDDCQNARPVGYGVFPDDNTDATTDGTASCGFAGNDGDADVWFEFTAPDTGTVVIDTCATGGTGSVVDTVLSVFDACGGNELACNDDVLNLCALYSLVELEVAEGVSYWIRVAEYRGRMGSFVLTISGDEPEGCGDEVCSAEESHDSCPADCMTLFDYADFQTCFAGVDGTYRLGCDPFDLNSDGRVNLTDHAALVENNLVGP